MREILFRGKRADNGEWVEGGILQTENWVSIFVCKDYQGSMNEPPCCDVEEYEVIPETVGQYTELLDKNEKEIFEGDFIKIISDCDYPDDYRISKVYVYNGVFCVDFRYYDFDSTALGFLVDYLPDGDFEVIGNVYDGGAYD